MRLAVMQAMVRVEPMGQRGALLQAHMAMIPITVMNHMAQAVVVSVVPVVVAVVGPALALVDLEDMVVTVVMLVRKYLKIG